MDSSQIKEILKENISTISDKKKIVQKLNQLHYDFNIAIVDLIQECLASSNVVKNEVVSTTPVSESTMSNPMETLKRLTNNTINNFQPISGKTTTVNPIRIPYEGNRELRYKYDQELSNMILDMPVVKYYSTMGKEDYGAIYDYSKYGDDKQYIASLKRLVKSGKLNGNKELKKSVKKKYRGLKTNRILSKFRIPFRVDVSYNLYTDLFDDPADAYENQFGGSYVGGVSEKSENLACQREAPFL
jgi:hypothetical protein